jgi:hypothetical protein
MPGYVKAIDCQAALAILSAIGNTLRLTRKFFLFSSFSFSFNQDGWHSAVQDQLILSHADIVMAAKTSSFTQSLPLSLVTGRVQYPDSPHNQPRRRVFIKKPFCEGVPPNMVCFESVGDWCCNTRDKKPTYHDVVPSWRKWV